MCETCSTYSCLFAGSLVGCPFLVLSERCFLLFLSLPFPNVCKGQTNKRAGMSFCLLSPSTRTKARCVCVWMPTRQRRRRRRSIIVLWAWKRDRPIGLCRKRGGKRNRVENCFVYSSQCVPFSCPVRISYFVHFCHPRVQGFFAAFPPRSLTA